MELLRAELARAYQRIEDLRDALAAEIMRDDGASACSRQWAIDMDRRHRRGG